MPETILTGCTPTPLAHYLKALAILRLVAEQKDETATGRWDGEHFVLHSALDRDGLERFFLDEYQPTPVLSPWNGRAGYLEGHDGESSNRAGAVLCREYRESRCSRLEPYRRIILAFDNTDALVEMNKLRSQRKDLAAKKKNRHRDWIAQDQHLLSELSARESVLKATLLTLLRNTLSDDLLKWLDAAIAVGTRNVFAPLLGGSGGAEGSMDLGVNFMENVKHIFQLTSGNPKAEAASWLTASIYGVAEWVSVDNSSGALLPGTIGGPNATSGFTAKLSINPWDYVLMLEGAIIFMPTLTKRAQSAADAALSYPFTVEPTAIGTSCASYLDEKKARAGHNSEVWMPLWAAPATYQEVSACFREGSVTLGRERAKTGLDFARAISQFGVDRGIKAFQRFIFLKRSGDNDIAVPLNRMQVTRNPFSDFIGDLDQKGFLAGLRKYARSDSAPGRIKQLVHGLEGRLFHLTQRKGPRDDLQSILSVLGAIQYIVGTSTKTREAVPPVPMLSERWVMMADDKSDEYRIACALASLWAPDMPMCAHLAPADLKSNAWLKQKGKLFVWGSGSLVANLVRVLERRLLQAARQGLKDKPIDGRLPADLAAVMAFLTGATDDNRISRLLTGLVLTTMPHEIPDLDRQDHHIPSGYSVLKLLFTTDRLLRWLRILPADARLPLPLEIVGKLRAGQTDDAVSLAWRRLRIAELGLPSFPRRSPSAKGMDGMRLAAALLIPLKAGDVGRLCRRLTMTRAEGYAFETT